MRTALWVAAVFLAGACTGGAVSGDDTKVEFIEVPRTEIIREPAPPAKEVAVMPESCQKALALTDRIVELANNIFDTGDQQIAILADARLYLASGQNTKSIDERQRRLHGKTVGDLFNLEKLFYDFNRYQEECEKDND